jgi:hypothetical protein
VTYVGRWFFKSVLFLGETPRPPEKSNSFIDRLTLIRIAPQRETTENNSKQKAHYCVHMNDYGTLN